MNHIDKSLQIVLLILVLFSLTSCENLLMSNKKKELLKKCEAGVFDDNLIACDSLAYEELKDRHYEKARKWYKKACRGQLPDSCIHLAKMEYNLNNKEEALKIYKKTNYDRSHIELVKLEIELHGKESTRKKYKAECDKGNRQSCFFLRMINDGVDDLDKYLILMQKVSCEKRDKKACDALTKIVEKNKRTK